MKSLARVIASRAAVGDPLPIDIPQVQTAGLKIRRGQQLMIAAPPNGGKTLLGQYLAIRWARYYNLKVMYFSADTDERTMAYRALSNMLNQRQVESERQIEAEEQAAFDLLQELHNIRWSFVTDLTTEHIEQEVEAFADLFGDYPDVVIVDNVMNVMVEGKGDDEWGSMRECMKFLHFLSRQINCATLALHHIREEDRLNPLYPAARRFITGKIAQVPEQIWSLSYDPNSSELRLAAVKNRNGKSDPNAERWFAVPCNADTMQVGVKEVTQW